MDKTIDIDNLIRLEKNFLSSYYDKICEGGLSDTEYYDLHELLSKYATPDIKIADVGCYAGFTTILFASYAFENKGRVWAIDNFRGSPTAFMINNSHRDVNVENILTKNIEFFGLREQVYIMKSDSVEASTKFNNEFFDFVFLDADHRYEAVKQDILTWLPKVKQGGILAGHDCEIIVKKGIDDLYNKWCNYDFVGMHLGTIKAVSELLPEAKIYESKPYNLYFPERVWWVTKGT